MKNHIRLAKQTETLQERDKYQFFLGIAFITFAKFKSYVMIDLSVFRVAQLFLIILVSESIYLIYDFHRGIKKPSVLQKQISR